MTPWTVVVGMTLVEFVWQGTLVALAAAVLLRLMRRRSPRLRYAIACSALALMVAAPVVTAYAQYGIASARPVVAQAVNADVRPLRTSHAGTIQAQPAAAGHGSALDARSAGRYLQSFVVIWLIGVAILLARLVVGWLRVRRLQAAALALEESRWAALGTALASRLRLSAVLRVVDSFDVDTPVVIGWLRPVVLLPVAALANLTPAQVEGVIAHELAHIRRHDFLVNVLQAIAETLLFYHPAVWWLSSRVRIEREHCCDDMAVELCGNPVEYAEALAHLASWSAPALSLGATSGPLLDRVRRLLRLEPRPTHAGTVATFALASLLAVAVVFLAGTSTIVAARAAGDDDATWLARLAELHRIVPDFHGHSVPGPMDVNRMMHYNLFPTPVRFPTDDPRDAQVWGVMVTFPGGETTVKGFTARSLVRYAYELGEDVVVDVPSWMENESVSLTASTPTAQPDTEDVLFAIRTALDRQMHVTLRREVRDYPVYALVKANGDGVLGPNIRPSEPGSCFTGEMLRDYAARGERLPFGQRTQMCGTEDSATGPSMFAVSMPQFAHAIERWTPDRPVIDRTGLTGTFDVRLQLGFVPFAGILTAHPDAAHILEPFGVRTMRQALPEQLGLRLDDATAPYEVVIVDGAVRPARP